MAHKTNVLLSAAVVSSAVNANGSAINVRSEDQVVAYVNVTLVTAGSVTFRIEGAPYAAGPWCTLATGAAISAVGTQAITASVCGGFVRLAWTIATGPVSFDGVSGDVINTAAQGGFSQAA